MIPRRIGVVWLLLASAGLQQGCMPSFQSEEAPTRIYWLEPDVTPLTTFARIRVDVVPGLDSDHIWILQQDRRLNYYAGAHWPTTLGVLLQSILERALGHPDASQAHARFDVLVERFFAVETTEGNPPAVELGARISRPDAKAPVCSFDAREVAATTRLRDVVSAHQTVLNRLIREVQRLASAADGAQPYACD